MVKHFITANGNKGPGARVKTRANVGLSKSLSETPTAISLNGDVGW